MILNLVKTTINQNEGTKSKLYGSSGSNQLVQTTSEKVVIRDNVPVYVHLDDAGNVCYRTLKQIESEIKKYKRKINESTETINRLTRNGASQATINKSRKALRNRQDWLTIWKDAKKEVLAQMKIVHV